MCFHLVFYLFNTDNADLLKYIEKYPPVSHPESVGRFMVV
jgi:hypothetical protein